MIYEYTYQFIKGTLDVCPDSNAKISVSTKKNNFCTGTVNSDSSDELSKENAREQIELLAKFTECEVTAENLIKARGYSDCIVFMGENVTSIAVMSEGLNEIDAANITQIAVDTGACTAEQVKIVEIKPN